MWKKDVVSLRQPYYSNLRMRPGDSVRFRYVRYFYLEVSLSFCIVSSQTLRDKLTASSSQASELSEYLYSHPTGLVEAASFNLALPEKIVFMMSIFNNIKYISL